MPEENMMFQVGERVRVNITRSQWEREFMTGDAGTVESVWRGYCMVRLDHPRPSAFGSRDDWLKDIWNYNLVSLCPRKAR
jgi:hypothetical protein